jgi:hypothetical protein
MFRAAVTATIYGYGYGYSYGYGYGYGYGYPSADTTMAVQSRSTIDGHIGERR